MKRLWKIVIVLALMGGFFGAVFYPFGFVIEDYSSDIGDYRACELYYVQKIFDHKEGMAGKTVLWSTEYYHQCGNRWETHYESVKVLADQWDSCEHNPDQNHTIGIALQPDVLFAGSENSYVSYVNGTESTGWTNWRKAFVWMDSKEVEGYVLTQSFFSNESPDNFTLFLLTTPFLFAVIGIFLLSIAAYHWIREKDAEPAALKEASTNLGARL